MSNIQKNLNDQNKNPNEEIKLDLEKLFKSLKICNTITRYKEFD